MYALRDFVVDAERAIIIKTIKFTRQIFMDYREKNMRGTVVGGCLLIVLLFSISGCDWSTDADYDTSQGAAYDLTGDFTLSNGWAPWDDIMIWQTGQRLRAQDSRGLFWEGTASGTGTNGLNWQWQIYLTCQNQRSGLTEWIRGRVLLRTTLMGTVVRLEGIYSRSDNAETSWFEADANYNAAQWPTEEEPAQ